MLESLFNKVAGLRLSCEYCKIFKGEDSLWNISFRLFYGTQFNAYFWVIGLDYI